MINQRELFDIPNDVSYLNGAYMSPQLKSVDAIGLKALSKKRRPWEIGKVDFFDDRLTLKQSFAELIDAEDPQQICIIPSVSYGIANVANNIPLEQGDQIIVVDEQFPSNIYAWQARAKEANAQVVCIKPRLENKDRGRHWNADLLDKIGPKTAVVAMPQVHWADGTYFDLRAIRRKCNEYMAKLVIDGTQSVGALPFSVQDIQPDALVCGGYKWLMGPYSLGLAYYATSFNDGNPIEYNWFNRYRSEDFTNLTKYQDAYQSGAERYSVGESSNFIMVPMLTEAIRQLIEWDPKKIQEYCHEISEDGIQKLRAAGCFIEDESYRSSHLFGIYLNENLDIEAIKARLLKAKVYVSYRGSAIRVSPHVYNSKSDMDKLVSLIY